MLPYQSLFVHLVAVPLLFTLPDGSRQLRFCTKMDFETQGSQCVEQFIYGNPDSLPCITIIDTEESGSNSFTVCEPGKPLVPLDPQRMPNLKMEYIVFCVKWMLAGFTPVFEFVSPACKVVIHYDEPKLVLVAIRHVRSGAYVSVEQMFNSAQMHKISHVQRLINTVEIVGNSLKEHLGKVLEQVQNAKGVEGAVIRFVDEYVPHQHLLLTLYCCTDSALVMDACTRSRQSGILRYIEQNNTSNGMHSARLMCGF